MVDNSAKVKQKSSD